MLKKKAPIINSAPSYLFLSTKKKVSQKELKISITFIFRFSVLPFFFREKKGSLLFNYEDRAFGNVNVNLAVLNLKS